MLFNFIYSKQYCENLQSFPNDIDALTSAVYAKRPSLSRRIGNSDRHRLMRGPVTVVVSIVTVHVNVGSVITAEKLGCAVASDIQLFLSVCSSAVQSHQSAIDSKIRFEFFSTLGSLKLDYYWPAYTHSVGVPD